MSEVRRPARREDTAVMRFTGQGWAGRRLWRSKTNPLRRWREIARRAPSCCWQQRDPALRIRVRSATPDCRWWVIAGRGNHTCSGAGARIPAQEGSSVPHHFRPGAAVPRRVWCPARQLVIRASACSGRSNPSLTAMSTTLCPETKARWAISAATAYPRTGSSAVA